MTRYRYEPGTLDVSAFKAAGLDDDIDLEIDESFEGYKIFDSQHGNTDDAWVAFSRDVDTAQRIVDLLNEDHERQHLKKIIEARESLGSEIVEVSPFISFEKQ